MVDGQDVALATDVLWVVAAACWVDGCWNVQHTVVGVVTLYKAPHVVRFAIGQGSQYVGQVFAVEYTNHAVPEWVGVFLCTVAIGVSNAHFQFNTVQR